MTVSLWALTLVVTAQEPTVRPADNHRLSLQAPPLFYHQHVPRGRCWCWNSGGACIEVWEGWGRADLDSRNVLTLSAG